MKMMTMRSTMRGFSHLLSLPAGVCRPSFVPARQPLRYDFGTVQAVTASIDVVLAEAEDLTNTPKIMHLAALGGVCVSVSSSLGTQAASVSLKA
jgi:hypothetical protein